MGGAAWTEEEDNLLKKCIEQYGEGKWHRVPSLAGLNRCRKSCRLRWLNYLRPNIKRGSFTPEEVELIIKFHKRLGNRWSLIAGTLAGRTANDVKNYWNCHLSKKLSAQETNNNFQDGKHDVETEFNVMIETSSMGKAPRIVQQQQQAQLEDDQNLQLLPLLLLPLTPKEEEISGLCLGGDLGVETEFQFGGVSSSSNSATKWEWDDLELDDMDLWTESL